MHKIDKWLIMLRYQIRRVAPIECMHFWSNESINERQTFFNSIAQYMLKIKLKIISFKTNVHLIRKAVVQY